MEHGGTIDPTAYLIGSSIQHHPERWPRSAEDGPITSWNRSLAFTLSNNGFDVWLAETRGSSDVNRKHIRSQAVKQVISGANKFNNMTKGENLQELNHNWNYWDFSQDDIIAHEIKSHMDTIMKKTGSEKLLVFTFSLSTPTSFAFFSIRPDYAEKVQGFVSMAPIVSGEISNKAVNLVMKYICPIAPQSLGTAFLDGLTLTQPIREVILAISKSRFLRYTLIKAVVNTLLGASPKYRTLLDENVLGHMLRSLSFKEAQQLCQQMKTSSLTKYDYGKVKNMKVYGQEKPPVYKLENFGVRSWIVVLAEHDSLSTPGIYKHLLRYVNPQPETTFVAPDFNHLDLIAGLENDRYVNLPILAYFKSRSTIPGGFIPDDSIPSGSIPVGSIPGVQNLHKVKNYHRNGPRQIDFSDLKLSDMESIKIPGIESLKLPDMNSLKLPDMSSLKIPGMESLKIPSFDSLKLPSLDMNPEIINEATKTIQKELIKTLNITGDTSQLSEQFSNINKMLMGGLNNVLSTYSKQGSSSTTYED